MPIAGLDTSQLSADESRALVDELESGAPDLFRKQILIALRVLRTGPSVRSYQAIGRMFGVSKGAIESHERRSLCDSETPGRQGLLTVDERYEICAMIEQRFADGVPMNSSDVADQIEIRYGKTLAMDTLRHIIRHIPGLKAIRGRLMEIDRAFCDTDEIDDFYRQLAASRESAPAS
jgi:hypothetical protein